MGDLQQTTVGKSTVRSEKCRFWKVPFSKLSAKQPNFKVKVPLRSGSLQLQDKIHAFVDHLDQEMDLVMITDRMDESLVSSSSAKLLSNAYIFPLLFCGVYQQCSPGVAKGKDGLGDGGYSIS